MLINVATKDTCITINTTKYTRAINLGLKSDCSFINGYPNIICEQCEFYQKNILPLDKSFKRLEKASKYFIDKTEYDNIWK